ncbi:5791_t:CDS:1, partial [Entrophospora sp. SA101]
FSSMTTTSTPIIATGLEENNNNLKILPPIQKFIDCSVEDIRIKD